jgi:hypothetical protein
MGDDHAPKSYVNVMIEAMPEIRTVTMPRRKRDAIAGSVLPANDLMTTKNLVEGFMKAGIC